MGSKPRILIADDDNETRELLRILLVREGFRVDGARDGIAALRIFEEARKDPEPIDLVVMDGAMPVMDGLTCAKAIRDSEKLYPSSKPVAIAFLTAHDEVTSDPGLLAQLNIAAVWKKPNDLTSLDRLVGGLLCRT